MKPIEFICILSFFFLITIPSYAQCEGRYEEEIFSDVDVSTVVYSDAYNLQMDIYQAAEDTEPMRPVIIFAHGGSFIDGSKTNQTMVELCETFAKRGYVCASINYRLASSAIALLDSMVMLDVVMKSISDAKASIRYFRQDAAGLNSYRIDPAQIFIGGNSAGAILAVHLAYIDAVEELPPYLAAIVNENGGIEGDSGNDGFSSDIKAVVNLAGGINNLSWLDEGEEPIFNAHGDADGVVPFGCGDVFQGTFAFLDLVDICGSGELHERALSLGIESELKVYEGSDHTPWSLEPVKMQEIIGLVSEFLFKYVDCEIASSISDVSPEEKIIVYPIPTSGLVNIEFRVNDKSSSNLTVYDALGRAVINNKRLSNTSSVLDLSQLESGVYHLLISAEGEATNETYRKSIMVAR